MNILSTTRKALINTLRSNHFTGCFVFIFALFVFNSNKTFFIASDSRGIASTTNWIAQGIHINLNTHPGYQTEDTFVGYWAKRLPNGNMVSIYPVSVSALASPFFWVAYQLGFSKSLVNEGLLAKWVAATMTAIACWATWYVILILFNPLTALTAAIMLIIGTPLFSTISQSLWMQTGALMCQALSILILTVCLTNFSKLPANRRMDAKLAILLVTCGFFAAWAAACRPSFGLWSVLTLAILFNSFGRKSLYGFGGSALALIAYCIVNYLTYGNALGIYNEKASDVGFKFDLSSSSVALAGLLVSPSRGLLLFCPQTILMFIGAFMAIRQRNRNWYTTSLTIFFVITLLMLAGFGQWWGGWSNGPRLQSDILIVGTILSGYALPQFTRSTLGWISIVVLLIPAVFVQVRSSKMVKYHWEEFAAAKMEHFMSHVWSWKTGNYRWILSDGKIERQLRGLTGYPDFAAPGITIQSDTQNVEDFLLNGFHLEPAENPRLIARHTNSRMVFVVNQESQIVPRHFAVRYSDDAPWGTFYTVDFLLNDHLLGSLNRISGTAPSSFAAVIPSEIINVDSPNILTVQAKSLPKHGGGDCSLIFSKFDLLAQKQVNVESK